MALAPGAVDAALNNYVALHYSSRHMSWLHCFWGIGASAGPYIMGLCIRSRLRMAIGIQDNCHRAVYFDSRSFFQSSALEKG